METVPHHPLIKVLADDVKKVRESYGIDDINRMNESLDIVYEWCKKQDHLVEASQYINRKVIERVYIIEKGSIERTKKRIDKLLTCRGLIKEISLKRTFNEFKDLLDCVRYVPLPKLCPTDQSRVMVTQFLSEKIDGFTVLSYFRYCFMVGEYRFKYDYSISERYIIDLANLNINFLTKLNPIVLKKAEILGTEGLGTKIKGIHILNAPPFVDKVVFIVKQALSEKVASRLHVHSTYEDLYQHIPKDVIPKDYGGDEQSCSKLADLWHDTLQTEEAKQIINEYDKLVSDETKRDSSKFNEEIMGMPGSFRMLSVD